MNKFLEGIKGLFFKAKPMSVLLTSVLIASVVVTNALVYALTNSLGLYLYSPDIDDLSISGYTDELFSEITESDKVTVMFCMSEDDLKLHSTGRYVYETVKQFEDRYDFLNVKYVNMLTHRDERGTLVDLSKYKVDMRGHETPIRDNSVIFISGENYRVLTDTYSSAGFADFFTLQTKHQNAV